MLVSSLRTNELELGPISQTVRAVGNRYGSHSAAINNYSLEANGPSNRDPQFESNGGPAGLLRQGSGQRYISPGTLFR